MNIPHLTQAPRKHPIALVVILLLLTVAGFAAHFSSASDKTYRMTPTISLSASQRRTASLNFQPTPAFITTSTFLMRPMMCNYSSRPGRTTGWDLCACAGGYAATEYDRPTNIPTAATTRTGHGRSLQARCKRQVPLVPTRGLIPH
jgi:hypothetical protein